MDQGPIRMGQEGGNRSFFLNFIKKTNKLSKISKNPEISKKSRIFSKK
jgi:hypothetical protein